MIWRGSGVYCIESGLTLAAARIECLCIITAANYLLQRTSASGEVLAPDRQSRLLAQALLLTMVATTLILLALGVYLLAGAPHFVRWHLKSTARFCAENPIE